MGTKTRKDKIAEPVLTNKKLLQDTPENYPFVAISSLRATENLKVGMQAMTSFKKSPVHGKQWH